VAAGTRLSGIRPLERSDIPRAASCISGQASPTKFTAFLEEVFFDSPWADPEIPSLIYVEDGEIVGTLMLSTRNMRFEGEPIRAVVSAFFWAHPRARSRGVGIRLLRELLEGPQDLTLTDGASDDVRRMWVMLGGRTSHLNGLSFIRLLDPWRFGADWITRSRDSRSLHHVLMGASTPLDNITRRFGWFAPYPCPPGTEVEPLLPTAMIDNLGTVASRVRLRSDFGEEYLEWLFARLRSLDGFEPFWLQGRRGAPWAELVLEKERPIGWYVCQLHPGEPCRVLQFAATDRGALTVFRHLARGAARRGATAVVGRLEASLVPALFREGRIVQYRQTSRMLVHAKEARIVDAVLAGDALLSRLDGEWWYS
jgi:GNAT superfamily N-acetyltransferase